MAATLTNLTIANPQALKSNREFKKFRKRLITDFSSILQDSLITFLLNDIIEPSNVIRWAETPTTRGFLGWAPGESSTIIGELVAAAVASQVKITSKSNSISITWLDDSKLLDIEVDLDLADGVFTEPWVRWLSGEIVTFDEVVFLKKLGRGRSRQGTMVDEDTKESGTKYAKISDLPGYPRSDMSNGATSFVVVAINKKKDKLKKILIDSFKKAARKAGKR